MWCFTIAVIIRAHFHWLIFAISTIFSKRSFSITSKSIFWSLAAYSPHPHPCSAVSHSNQFNFCWWYSFVLCLSFWVKHVVIVYETVLSQGISHQICRNTAARKIYLHIIMSLAHKKKKKLNTIFFFSENRNYFIYIFFLVILFIMHILGNSQLRKLMSNFKKWRR